MEEEDDASPFEFRHDSMLRIEQPKDPQPAPTKKPRTRNSSAKSTIKQATDPFGFQVLHAGEASGISFAVVSVKKPVVFSGCAWLSVLSHQVRVFGSTVDPSQEPVLAVSAPFAPLLLKLVPRWTSPDGTTKVESTTDPERKYGPAALVHHQIRTSLGSDFNASNSKAPIILVSSFPRGNHAWKEADGFCESDDLAFSLGNTLKHLSLPHFDGFIELLPTLRISRSTEHTASFEEWIDWDSFSHEIDKFLAQRQANELRILVSGSGGSGKSTFVRCLSNHLVSLCKSVVLIDTDVGQPEQNLPGLVAAHHVSETHLGSAIAHIRGVPLVARFLGETTPRDDPELYDACVATVSDNAIAYAKRQGVPIIINTDGWVTGAGSAFLDTVVTRTMPTHVVCMSNRKGQGIGSLANVHADDLGLHVFNIPRPPSTTGPLYTRSVARELQVAAYFSKELSLGRVRAVVIDQLPVMLRGEEIRCSSRALQILNGSIIAVATSTTRSNLQLMKMNIAGYGLVRGVSLEKKMAYISSPIPPSLLKQSAALLVCEHLHIPNAVMLAAASNLQARLDPPFLLRDHADGSHRMHSRSSLQRRATSATNT